MGFKRKYKKLETEVSDSETYYDDDFTRLTLYLKDDRFVNFELPKAIEVKKEDKILFHNCKIKMVNAWYIDNNSYSLLEIFSKGVELPYFTLKGSEANRLERLAAKRFAAEEAQKRNT